MSRSARTHNRADVAALPLARLAGMDACALDEQAAALVGFRAYVRFESRDPGQDRDRYYDLLWQPTLFGEGALVRVWGRRGRSATTRVSAYADRAYAQRVVRQLIRTRLRHGYRVTDWH